jgi:signal peptidase II
MRKSSYAFTIVASVVILDQITKYLVSNYLSPVDSIEIFPFLHIVHVWNTGSAFGMFKNLGSSFFILVSIVAIIIVIYLLNKSTYNRFGLSLILGGALGNLIDRVRFGKVFDFLDFSVGDFHWPAFNVADSSLTIGMSVVFFLVLIKKES